ncbi:MAG: polar growth protein [Chrysothrix sp. TS-e1954]|nr:MAG: polar growth protein [Chrysothrix sp. TS-e1954]
MATKSQAESARNAQYGAILLVIHEFTARSTDELSLAKGDRIELIERDDDFGDGWYLGRHLSNGKTGLFPEVYTTCAPKGTHANTAAPRPGASGQSTTSMRSASTPSHIMSQLSQSVAGGSKKPPTTSTSPYAMTAATSAGQREPTDRYSQNQAPGSITKVTQSTAPTSTNAIDRTSAVMNETLSVIDEHITDMRKPGLVGSRPYAQKIRSDSASSYGAQASDTRLSYIQGSETEEEESNKLTEREVKSWSPERVAEYLEDVGVEKRHCEVFVEQEFSGEVVLALDQSSVFLKELDLGPIGRRLKTWQKIRALQEEVTGPRPSHTRHVSESSQTTSRRTSITSSAMLPKSGGTFEKQGFDGSDGVQANHAGAQAQPGSPHGISSPSLRQTSRPSAASVRSLGHSRRQSSIDQTLNPPTSSASAANSPYLTQSGHTKQPSLDRNWNMNAAKNRSTPDVTRPVSTHVPTPSSDRITFDKRASQLTLNTMTSTVDFDRGYVSSGEGENRSKKRVLRRREEKEHNRASSYDTSKRRSILSFRRSSRATSPNRTSIFGTPDLNNYTVTSKPATETATTTTTKTTHRRQPRVVSEPTADGSSPAVTKLEYDDAATAGSSEKALPRVPSQQSPGMITTSQPTQSPTSTTTTQSHAAPTPSKGLSGGLRVISDAITNKEKALHSIYAVDSTTTQSTSSPQSPTSSTAPTSSSTSKSKSIDYDDANKSQYSTSTTANPNGGTPAATRRKSKSKPKKKTSAYIRGLEKKSPAEQMIGCDYSGWMKKKSSNLMTTWKPRFFILRGRRLSYYYSLDDTEEKGLIDISGHRVLPADNERLTGLHATLTGAMNSPTSPQSKSNPSTTASTPSLPASSSDPTTTHPTASASSDAKGDNTGTYIFKLLPPRPHLQRSITFTRPSIHYFAVPSLAIGRAWMAALLRVTIDRDESVEVVSTYQLKTISLERARARKERPPALRGYVDLEEEEGEEEAESLENGIGIGTGAGVGEAEAHHAQAGAAAAPDLAAAPPAEEEEDDNNAGITNLERGNSASNDHQLTTVTDLGSSLRKNKRVSGGGSGNGGSGNGGTSNGGGGNGGAAAVGGGGGEGLGIMGIGGT